MTDYRFVEQLPDLIHPEDYAADPAGRRVRVRIQTSAEGVAVLGDAMRPEVLEQMLQELGAEVIEQMLCG